MHKVDEDKSKTPGFGETDLFATCEPALAILLDLSRYQARLAKRYM